eukprot:2149423-Amphidinium_carterae.1
MESHQPCQIFSNVKAGPPCSARDTALHNDSEGSLPMGKAICSELVCNETRVTILPILQVDSLVER